MVSCAGMYQRIPENAKELIESTSGNTGYASAVYAKKIGLPIRVFMPEGMSKKKHKMLSDLGAMIHETPRDEYTSGARNQAQAHYEEDQEKRQDDNGDKKEDQFHVLGCKEPFLVIISFHLWPLPHRECEGFGRESRVHGIGLVRGLELEFVIPLGKKYIDIENHPSLKVAGGPGHNMFLPVYHQDHG